MRRLFGGLGARGASGEKPKKPIRANLGDESSFYYDEKLKSWVDRNDKSGAAGGGGGDGDASSLPPPPTSAPPTPAMPIRPSSTAASSTNGGDGDGSAAPGSNPLSRSNSLSHVRNRYVDVFAGAASTAVSSGASTPGMTPAFGSAANLLAPVLPGSFVPAPTGANKETGHVPPTSAPKFFVPAVPSQSSMTETSAEEEDDDDADGERDGRGSRAHARAHAGGVSDRESHPIGGGRLGLDRLIVPERRSSGDDGSTMLRGEGATVSPKAAKGGHHHARGPTLTAIATGGGAREEGTEILQNGPSGIGEDAIRSGSSSVREASGPLGSPPSRLQGDDARDSKSRLGDWAQALGRVSEGMSSPKAAASARVSENFAPDGEPKTNASAFGGQTFGGSGDAGSAPRVAPGGFFVPTSGPGGGVSSATDDDAGGSNDAGSLLGGGGGLLGEPALLQPAGDGGGGGKGRGGGGGGPFQRRALVRFPLLPLQHPAHLANLRHHLRRLGDVALETREIGTLLFAFNGDPFEHRGEHRAVRLLLPQELVLQRERLGFDLVARRGGSKLGAGVQSPGERVQFGLGGSRVG
mmetsp:Transcript_13616/g.55126  ORF Transcript_13616/g.55126 Transcript_13616/m.55126 type:complete len:580 (-) Transcript_13616:471-2210(-)